MYATDFNYNGSRLSDFGFTICNFDGATDIMEVQAGTPLTFKTVSRNKGKKFSLVDLNYDSYLEITFDICKDPCVAANINNMVISDELYLTLCKWLMQEKFLQLSFDDDTHSITRYYDGSFNVSKIMFNDELYGLRLTCTTNRPYAYSDSIGVHYDLDAGGSFQLTNRSVLCGTIRPNMLITCNADGNLVLKNTTTGSVMKINNCTNGEWFTVYGDEMIIQSSKSTHKLWNDFNYEFLTITLTNESAINTITANMACTVQLTYRPIIRDAP